MVPFFKKQASRNLRKSLIGKMSKQGDTLNNKIPLGHKNMSRQKILTKNS
jgi:hypothetical protein